MSHIDFFCCLSEQAKDTLLEQNAAAKIVVKLQSLEKTFEEHADNRTEIAACGSVINITSENGKLNFILINSQAPQDP